MGKRKESKVDEWLTEDSLYLIKCWSRDGVTVTAMAETMGIAPKTLNEWKNTYPEIAEAMSRGREIVDYKVESALYKRAIGCKVKEVKTIVSPQDKDGNRPVRIETTEKELPPDTTACLAWLNNRRTDKWKRNRDNFIEAGENDNVVINIVRAGEKQKVKVSGADDDDDDDWDAVEG